MTKVFKIALGIVTSIGGFLEAGSVTTAAQAGATFHFQLAWAIVLGTLCLIFLIEMAGRLAAVSKHTIVDAIRDRFGFNFFLVLLIGVGAVSVLVLAAEIGGVCLALQFVSGLGFPWWAVPVAFLGWLLIWKGSFGIIEQGTSLLGLVTLSFLVAAVRLDPPVRDLAAGLLPSLPAEQPSRYWFLAVSIFGASVTPYLFYFYSSGAIEDRWDQSHLGTNRLVATVGMTFGGVLSLAVLVVAAMVFGPRAIQIDRYEQVALMLTDPLPVWGFFLFAASLGIACFGAAVEITLALAYLMAQGFGWNWGENLSPSRAARFSVAYTVIVALAALVVLTGIDPLKLTNVSMALTAAVLPVAIAPFLVLMNDGHYMRQHTNGWLGNAVVLVTMTLASVLAVVVIPLEIFGG